MRWWRAVLLVLLVVLLEGAVAKGGRGGGGRGRSHSRTSSGSRPRFIKKLTKPGSIEHTSMFRSALFGAAAGYLTFSAGRHIINEPSAPIQIGGKQYFWDNAQYADSDDLPVQCSHRIDPNDPQFGRVFFNNETRPQELNYSCAKEDYCCGFECCQESTFFTSLFSLLVLILVLSVVTIFVIECVRWCLHCTYLCKHGRPREFEPLSI